MNIKRLACLVLGLAIIPVTWAQTTEATATAQPSPTKENAQLKALREQQQREATARKAELDAAIAADIAKNPDGANAQAAKKATEDAKALELVKQTAEEKTQADADAAAKVAAAQAEKDTKAAAATWAAGAAERDRAAAAKKKAVEKWRASGKAGPNIMIGHRADGTFTVMVDGVISTFATNDEAQAFADKVRNSTETTLSY